MKAVYAIVAACCVYATAGAAASVTVAPADVAELRGARAVWVPIESGAPGIYFPSEGEIQRCDDRRDAVIQAFLRYGKLASGPYDVRLWNPVDDTWQSRHIFVTAAHLALLRNANWQCGMVDPKRPYGDMTYFEIDMARILGIPLAADGKPSPDDQRRLDQLHDETLPALAAFLAHAVMAPGTYALRSRFARRNAPALE